MNTMLSEMSSISNLVFATDFYQYIDPDIDLSTISDSTGSTTGTDSDDDTFSESGTADDSNSYTYSGTDDQTDVQ